MRGELCFRFNLKIHTLMTNTLKFLKLFVRDASFFPVFKQEISYLVKTWKEISNKKKDNSLEQLQ